jgi:probable rRNA maturation factor
MKIKMMSLTMAKNTSSGIRINISIECNAVVFDRRKIIDLIRQTAEHFRVRNAQINIVVVDDKKITAVNRQFLDKDAVTDVISFDISDDDSKEKSFDIAVNAQMAQRQARVRGHEASSELTLYILHGLLHHLGFDDATAAQSAKMHKTEDDILKKFGFGVVYAAEKR